LFPNSGIASEVDKGDMKKGGISIYLKTYLFVEKEVEGGGGEEMES
jgi:hypothetical protein